MFEKQIEKTPQRQHNRTNKEEGCFLECGEQMHVAQEARLRSKSGAHALAKFRQSVNQVLTDVM